jgi:hypothetical protein
VPLIASAVIGASKPAAVVGYWSGHTGRWGWVDAIIASGVPGRNEIELNPSHWMEIPQFPDSVE